VAESTKGVSLHVPGYVHRRLDRIRLIAKQACAPVLERLLERGTLYELAAQVPGAFVLQGRQPVYVVTLPEDCGEVAVRHSARGGFMASLTRDRFILPTGGFRELVNSLRLRQVGIPTPEVIAFATYPAGFGTRRADVLTRYVHGHDLAAMCETVTDSEHRRAMWDATAIVVKSLSRVGAHHQDLNLKNVLLVPNDQQYEGYVLDVDRVRLNPPSPLVLEANLGRLLRSLRKWKDQRKLSIHEEELNYLTAQCHAT
jgi:3-deoxy-D-manno-octulosonic acid kinase